MLPSSQVRWCTVNLKIKPFEDYVGEDRAYNYVAIRADEDRVGYKPLKTPSLRNIEPKVPIQRETASPKRMSIEYLEESGLGLPDYYQVADAFRDAISASSSVNPNGLDC